MYCLNYLMHNWSTSIFRKSPFLDSFKNIYNTNYFFKNECKEPPPTYSIMIFIWLLLSTVSKMRTIFTWLIFWRSFISLRTPFLRYRSLILLFSYILIATFLLVLIYTAKRTAAYAPYPTLDPTLYYSLNASVFVKSSTSSTTYYVKNFISAQKSREYSSQKALSSISTSTIWG